MSDASANHEPYGNDITSFKAEMMSFGYAFAKNFGGAFPRNELIDDLLFHARAINRTDEEYINWIIENMLDHEMILREGSKFVWNRNYRPHRDDLWCDWDVFA